VKPILTVFLTNKFYGSKVTSLLLVSKKV